MAKQISFNLNKASRGGRRSGSGRKRLHSKGVAHRTRERMTFRNPLHINFKYRLQVRNKEGIRLLKRAIMNARRFGLNVVHYSLQSNHIHLIVETENNETLTQGMRSLTITMAKGIKQGKVQLERYHLHVLKTLRETRNAVHYVIFNEQKHSGMKKAYVDQYSSLVVIQNLKELAKEKNLTIVVRKINELPMVAYAKSWLLKRSVPIYP